MFRTLAFALPVLSQEHQGDGSDIYCCRENGSVARETKSRLGFAIPGLNGFCRLLDQSRNGLGVRDHHDMRGALHYDSFLRVRALRHECQAFRGNIPVLVSVDKPGGNSFPIGSPKGRGRSQVLRDLADRWAGPSTRFIPCLTSRL